MEDLAECPSCNSSQTKSELRENSGVCLKCKSKFQKKHPNLKAFSEPAPIEHRVKNGATFADGHIEGHADFSYELVDGAEGESEEQKARDYRIAVQAVAKFCGRITDSGRSQRRFFQMAHCLMFANHTHPMQDKSESEIAKVIGMKKANFSKEVNKFRDRMNLPRIAGAKSMKARKVYSAKTKQNHDIRKHNSRSSNGAFFNRLSSANQRKGIAD